MGLRRNGTNGFIQLATIVAVFILVAASLVVPAFAAPALIEISHLGPDTVVTEGGPNDGYIMRLTTQPTSDVFVTVDPRGDVVVSPTSLVFTPANFNTYQGVLVSAMNDLNTEVTETVMLRHTAASADANFRGAAPFSPSDRLSVVILDNDRQPEILIPTGGVCLMDSEVEFAGLGGRLQALAIIVDGVAEVLASVGMDETWSTTAVLDDGAHTVVAKDTDGRISSPLELRVDSAGLITPKVTSPVPGEIVGPTVTVEGTAEPGAAIVVADGAGTTLGTTSAAGDGSWGLEVMYPASGPQTLFASSMNCRSSLVEFIVDASGPAITIATSEDPQIAPLEPLTVEGSAKDAAVVAGIAVLVVNDLTGEEIEADVTCVGCPGQDVTWQATADALSGPQTITVTGVDGLGNVSTQEIMILKV